jgi:hypothetical protein
MTITVQFDGKRARLFENGQEVTREQGLMLVRALADTYTPPHHVYIAYSPTRAAYKVGHSEKPHERVRALKAELVYSHQCDNYSHMKQVQKALIAELERCGQPVEDEWFALTADTLADILRRYP